MTHLQTSFLEDLKSQEKLTVAAYAALLKTHIQRAIAFEENNGASKSQAKAMGNYYTVRVLSDFIANENKLARIIALQESK
ncbi:hypothetical protein JHD48_01375 [Sulfurimonas sp. SAG-AH-194-I05]|nr:hypothetical protein [Sulfurimonas sp. SAG-AH-194-I05]MDF1874380.1 hypothetical protein [Sulfurimonas sp. SAG-AH-194-I05]